MKQGEEFSEAEIIQSQIIACPKCGQRNRLSNEPGRRFRCGSCKFELSPKQNFSSISSFLSALCSLRTLKRPFIHIREQWHWYTISAFVILVFWLPKYSATPRPGPMPYQVEPFVVQSPTSPALPVTSAPSSQVSPQPEPKINYVRPQMAPNGQPWPDQASYIKGFPRLHSKGLSIVTVDNIQNDTDVLVKLVSLKAPKAYPIRTFYIPAKATFTLTNITAGSYDIRYQDLLNGTLLRSESFSLEEIPMQGKTQYSTVTMTLYKVPYGNMQTYPLLATEF